MSQMNFAVWKFHDKVCRLSAINKQQKTHFKKPQIRRGKSVLR